ncbi:WxL domain-containing protein [Enterococcus caccae]|uniref:WxL domain-containing protein n=1 Tax=Enterococcus caccae ATCC BAA-1240 TaxID=1158612 RepID=R3U7M6_9ENTE|nr:WxL domain-containing protein [Enterococcus caccae]EOL49939.1 hypothetical protein UC7_00604 [Enterococcus caccae ATCC BAA-1240]EOT56279.1 hypothetical protein I580_03079 [Enterococcus caccae ATCC BAA-1240]OJG26541.1 hypothetical protein RU98_GL000597 [Enterococcus caccae]
MKKIHWIPTFLFVAVGLSSPVSPSYAETPEKGDMGISFKGLIDPEYGVLDPENPSKELEPEGDYGHTTGALRIDFVPNFYFSRNKITVNDSTYSSDALLFKGAIAPRGQFIQVSDYRENQTGWSLQVRQEQQFTNQKKAGSQLDGAVLSFDKSWVNTFNGASHSPSVSKEVIRLNNIGETYTLAQASKGTGGGTWSVVFGASKDNLNEETATLNPRLDEHGKPVIDVSKENQAVYMNEAVRLSLPGGTKKEPGTYSTVLTWIISELP